MPPSFFSSTTVPEDALGGYTDGGVSFMPGLDEASAGKELLAELPSTVTSINGPS